MPGSFAPSTLPILIQCCQYDAMLYPQKGNIAMGSWRNLPRSPDAAAVFSEETMDPMKVPWFQSLASLTRGTTVARRPPNNMALMGTPCKSSASFAMTGHCLIETVKRALGCAAVVSLSGVQSFPFQSTKWSGGVSVIPSHQTSPSSVSATLVNMQLP